MATKTIIFFIAMAIGSTVAQTDLNNNGEIMAIIQRIYLSNDRSNSTINIITQEPYQFRYLPANRNGCFSFRVKAARDAHISLSTNAMYENPKIKVIIGGWGEHMHSAIVLNDLVNQPQIYKSTPSILNEDEYRGFWVKWSQHGDILVGKVKEFFPFLVYKHSEPWFPFNFIGVTTLNPVKGDWIVDEIPSCPTCKF